MNTSTPSSQLSVEEKNHFIFISNLFVKLSRNDLYSWEKKLKHLLDEAEYEKAIEAVDTVAGDKEAARKHIRKAELYIVNYQFDDAKSHFKKAIAISPTYIIYLEIANTYRDLDKRPEALEYYNQCLTLAFSPEEEIEPLNNMSLIHFKNNDYPAAENSLSELLLILRFLSAENPDVYLPIVAATLKSLGIVQKRLNAFPEAEASFSESLNILKQLT